MEVLTKKPLCCINVRNLTIFIGSCMESLIYRNGNQHLGSCGALEVAFCGLNVNLQLIGYNVYFICAFSAQKIDHAWKF